MHLNLVYVWIVGRGIVDDIEQYTDLKSPLPLIISNYEFVKIFAC